MTTRALRMGVHVTLILACTGGLSAQTIKDKAAVAVVQYKADHGDAESQYMIGMLYQQGELKEKNLPEAARWLQKAADHGHSLGQFLLGMAYFNADGVSRDYAEAAHWFRAAGDQGQVDAQFILGGMYFSGQYLRKDWAQAASLLRTPADNGDADAQQYLGRIYIAGGFGMERDYAQAARWLKRAARQGDATSQYLLGSLFWTGNGVPQDPVTAHMWLNLAAAGGIQRARDYLDEAEDQMSEQQIADARRLAREWSPVKESK